MLYYVVPSLDLVSMVVFTQKGRRDTQKECLPCSHTVEIMDYIVNFVGPKNGSLLVFPLRFG